MRPAAFGRRPSRGGRFWCGPPVRSRQPEVCGIAGRRGRGSRPAGRRRGAQPRAGKRGQRVPVALAAAGGPVNFSRHAPDSLRDVSDRRDRSCASCFTSSTRCSRSCSRPLHAIRRPARDRRCHGRRQSTARPSPPPCARVQVRAAELANQGPDLTSTDIRHPAFVEDCRGYGRFT